MATRDRCSPRVDGPPAPALPLPLGRCRGPAEHPPTLRGAAWGAGPGQPAATPGAVSALPRRKGPLSSRGHPPLPPPSGPTSRGLCGMLCPCCGICASVWGLEGDYYSYLLLIIIYSPPPPRSGAAQGPGRPPRAAPAPAMLCPSLPGPAGLASAGLLEFGTLYRGPAAVAIVTVIPAFFIIITIYSPPSPTLPRREVIQTPSCPIRPKRRRLPRVGQVEPGAGWGWGGGDKSIDKPEICWK